MTIENNIKNVVQFIRDYQYTWVDISPVNIQNKHRDIAGKYRCEVNLSDGSNIPLKSDVPRTDAWILARAQDYCDTVNAANTKQEVVDKLTAFRNLIHNKIQELQA